MSNLSERQIRDYEARGGDEVNLKKGYERDVFNRAKQERQEQNEAWNKTIASETKMSPEAQQGFAYIVILFLQSQSHP